MSDTGYSRYCLICGSRVYEVLTHGNATYAWNCPKCGLVTAITSGTGKEV